MLNRSKFLSETMTRYSGVSHASTYCVSTRGVVRRWMFGACVTVLLPVLVLGWVFPEHRDIAVLAVHQLSASPQASLQSLWTEARAGHEVRLCAR